MTFIKKILDFRFPPHFRLDTLTNKTYLCQGHLKLECFMHRFSFFSFFDSGNTNEPSRDHWGPRFHRQKSLSHYFAKSSHEGSTASYTRRSIIGLYQCKSNKGKCRSKVILLFEWGQHFWDTCISLKDSCVCLNFKADSWCWFW